MSHDTYICYDKEDEKIGKIISHVLENNGISSWTKAKYMSENDSVDKIMDAISNSKCFLLLLSKKGKGTNYITTETDIAFSKNIPIAVLNIDESKIHGNLEFILETQTMIPSFSDSKRQLEALVEEISRIIKRPISNPRIDSECVKKYDKVNPHRIANLIKKCVKIAVPIAVVLILVYFFVLVPTGQNTTDDGIFSMNVTNVDVSQSNGNYKYTVYGESFNLPSDSVRYMMNMKFLDNEDNLIYEINSTADEFKYGILGSCELPQDNITHIAFKLSDMHNKVLSKEDYRI